MGAPNFGGCGRFGTYAFIYEYNEEYFDEEFPDATEEQKQKIFEDISSWEYECVSNEVKGKIEDFNRDLVFYKLGLAPGYYEGIEVILEDKPVDEDIETLSEILQDERGYWNHPEVRMTEKHKRNVQRIYDEECDKIEDFLDRLCKENGFTNLDVVARFSNGETWYRKASDEQKKSGPEFDPVADFYAKSFSKRSSPLSRMKSKLSGGMKKKNRGFKPSFRLKRRD